LRETVERADSGVRVPIAPSNLMFNTELLNYLRLLTRSLHEMFFGAIFRPIHGVNCTRKAEMRTVVESCDFYMTNNFDNNSPLNLIASSHNEAVSS
jgi:hypothetical protein